MSISNLVEMIIFYNPDSLWIQQMSFSHGSKWLCQFLPSQRPQPKPPFPGWIILDGSPTALDHPCFSERPRKCGEKFRNFWAPRVGLRRYFGAHILGEVNKSPGCTWLRHMTTSVGAAPSVHLPFRHQMWYSMLTQLTLEQPKAASNGNR